MHKLWGDALRSIEPKLKPSQLELWLRPIECLSISDQRIVLRAPNRYHKEWFEDNYLPSILSSIEESTKTSFLVDFEIAEEAPPIRRPERDESSPMAMNDGTGPNGPGSNDGASPRPSAAITVQAPVYPPSKDLSPRYTFDNFVVGPTNQFAHSAARMVAESPASRWNPLFIYGGVGLGKTHLLHAVGNEIQAQNPSWKIVCMPCERFVTDFIGSMMTGRRAGAGVGAMEDFRRKYREAPDVLLIDDVQSLSNKDSTQDEFFHTFNALHLAHKQIVLTCDKLPGELHGLEDRLRSRFTWGLIAEIAPPDLETRVAILKSKAAVDKVDLADDVAMALASQVKSNVRELEGALIRLLARSSIEKRPITLDLVNDTLRGYIATKPASLSIEAIQREVASYFDVRLPDLRGPRRHRTISHPRAVAMFLARKLTNMSYPEIGSRFGGKDHSTVISAVRKIERLSAEDPALRSILGTIESHLLVD